MWKLIVGFIVFAAIALFVLMRGGDIDMSGEKHGMDHAPEVKATASEPAAAPAPAPASASAPAAAPVAAASDAVPAAPAASAAK